MTPDPSNYHREYSPYGSYSLFQFEGSDVISVLKNSTEYSFVFFKVAVGPKPWTNRNLKQIITTDCTKAAIFQLLLPLDISKLVERQLTQ